MATLSALVSGLEAELRRLGYKDSTLVWYRGCWRRMQKHFAARGIETEQARSQPSIRPETIRNSDTRESPDRQRLCAWS